ncbi:MAG: KilA-N domain-containing protein, partial [bacterium]
MPTGNNLIPRVIEGNIVGQRVADGYVNATAMCKAARKQWGHYNENDTTKAFFAALEADIGIPISELIQSVKG